MWEGVMKQFYLHPGTMQNGGIFRKQFEEALEAYNPHAHYLEALKYARWEKDLKMVKKHAFKAINKVPEATFLMAMLAKCGGEMEIFELVDDELHSLPWGEVLQMGDSVLNLLTRMGNTGGNSYAGTYYGPLPDCAKIHNIHDRCEECFIHFCSAEFCERC